MPNPDAVAAGGEQAAGVAAAVLKVATGDHPLDPASLAARTRKAYRELGSRDLTWGRIRHAIASEHSTALDGRWLWEGGDRNARSLDHIARYTTFKWSTVVLGHKHRLFGVISAVIVHVKSMF